jgi:hypothetical protein
MGTGWQGHQVAKNLGLRTKLLNEAREMGISTLSTQSSFSVTAAATATATAAPVTDHTVRADEPLLSAARQLVQLNLQYLEMAAIVSEFPVTIAMRLRALSGVQRVAIADCRFSLFSLALNDAHRWLPLLGEPLAATPQDACSRRDLSRHDLSHRDAVYSEFVTTALFFAWHLVQSDPLAARVLLAVDAQVATALRALPVAGLCAVSHRALELLTPRWPQHPYFWPAFLRYSSEPTSNGLAATKLLGRQLLAAESLDMPLVPHSVGRVVVRGSVNRVSKKCAVDRLLVA